ncbi:MAG: endo alpha-1,4 polygalactosaminidase [Acidipropionibacterium acidipropionici]|jgi:endo-alpha-1,4-polygalactosaminidase (GH114 family)|uniref:Glycoside-hydrolase family GH114 TIM-barrel domain-containing protein n=2 Tax=Acidipropionibacterium acidipropionici TaxID=1748 RepID=A0AAC9FCG4_9ACTN|nr:endo alpha-1,4 polygalactosaminidase [Acidipropionibacterium acidipropionici]AFV88794.1 Secreted protein [Acidipropionibacterium acidipropionici ATCC 4875]AMS06538.1 hypothetical protein AXH35_14860 [Acidipropionibacterium acidipropionici]AZP38669.1 hypothetical protein DUY81_13500 [Acidipropionibacterium acidipropionici]
MLRTRRPALLAMLAGFLVLASCSPGPTFPPAAGRADYQIGGAYRPDDDVAIVIRDVADTPVAGRYNICYVNAFQTQPGTLPRWRREHPGLVLSKAGAPVTDPDWPGEALLDTSTPANRTAIVSVIGKDLERCAQAGFDAVELDNLDSYLRSGGRISPADNAAMAGLLARRAHSLGMAAAQKNAPEIGDAGRRAGLDLAVAEECQVYDECDHYTRLYGSRVIEIEYTDNGVRAFEQACRARGSRISVLLRDRDVVPRGRRGHVARWCS